MNQFLKILLPVLVLLVSGSIAYYAISNKPEAKRKPPKTTNASVEVIAINKQDYSVSLQTQGSVRPHTETTLVAQVSGEITHVSPDFSSGSFFNQGDLLLRIDPRDYQTAVTLAESNLAQARLRLSQEQARADQARRDWERLGETGKPSDLVLRKPQLQSEKANIAAARAQLEQAKLNLQRTRITAPYAGRLLEKNADLGQFVNPGNVLGKIYAVDFAEVRLPLNNNQLAFVDIPEAFRGKNETPETTGPEVLLKANIGGKVWQWPARIVRSEGAIDTRSRQTFVVAKVNDPYSQLTSGQPPLKVGQFVEAEIKGRTLENVLVIAAAALHAGNQIFLVDEEQRLRKKQIEIVWHDGESIVITSGLNSGDNLVVTPVSNKLAGSKVIVVGKENKPSSNLSSQRTDH